MAAVHAGLAADGFGPGCPRAGFGVLPAGLPAVVLPALDGGSVGTDAFACGFQAVAAAVEDARGVDFLGEGELHRFAVEGVLDGDVVEVGVLVVGVGG